ncbi:MAG: DEAD/DEAH box helicase, partial [Kiritimatiellaeota bacterium]|nr:DEAD/DEAH box helicase [Kiritimatiellota bacterium]
MNGEDDLIQSAKYLEYCLGRKLAEEETDCLKTLFESWMKSKPDCKVGWDYFGTSDFKYLDDDDDKREKSFELNEEDYAVPFQEFCISFCLKAREIGWEAPEFLTPFTGAKKRVKMEIHERAAHSAAATTDEAAHSAAATEHAPLIDELKKLITFNEMLATEKPQEAEAPEPVVFADQLRLVIGAKSERLVWETRAEDGGAWSAMTQKAARALFEAYENETLVFGGATDAKALMDAVVFNHYKCVVSAWSRDKDISNLAWSADRTKSLVIRLLENDVLRRFIVMSGGSPIAWPPVRLRWKARLKNGDEDTAEFFLASPEGFEISDKTLGKSFEIRRGSGMSDKVPAILISDDGATYERPPRLLSPSRAPASESRLTLPLQALRTPEIFGHYRRAADFSEIAQHLPPVRVERLAAELSVRRDDYNANRFTMDLTVRSPDRSFTRKYNGKFWEEAEAAPSTTNKNAMDLVFSKLFSAFGLRKTQNTSDTTPEIPSAPEEFVDRDFSAGETVAARLRKFNPVWRGWVGHGCTVDVRKTQMEEFADTLRGIENDGCALILPENLKYLVEPPTTAEFEFTLDIARMLNDKIDWFDLQFEFKASDLTLTKDEIKLLLDARGRFVDLPGKGWRRMVFNMDAAAGESLRSLGIDIGALDHTSKEKHRFHALQLAESRIGGLLAEEHAQMVRERVARIRAIPPPPLPAGLNAILRPYQTDGFHFLTHISENGFGAILADDMGLGKTLQALSHILLEKEKGRLTKPALIVTPTSLISNWHDEASRFTPGLNVLLLQGKDRAKRFERINQYDIVLTTYALLPRDEKELQEHEYHLLILDESQYIKNTKSKAAQIATELKARHRLCLTGTPLENHLGELWSQFHFLLPGLLGNERVFNSDFRHPIEKLNDENRRTLLVRRIRPFLLRRTKEKVASELPPKTEIVRNIEITGVQRDLYETVRLAMDKKIREEIAKKGIARSQIVILKALLKLRQVCCDPRLVKGIVNRKETLASSKLVELMNMVEELLLEDRRILIFSQFTSMLALIEAELHARQIPYALLTGDTMDRAGAIRTFQEGHVRLFLISLKAGGVGLNLTAADTVIHYDPWWNPAVENQATDR